MRHAYMLMLLAIAGLITAPATNARADDPSVMLLIDGSGSMWGPYVPDRRAKIDVVREQLATRLTAASQTRVGLASFGHRRRGDCSDTEVIAPADISREPLLTELQKLNPRGKGPLAKGLLDAAKALGPARPASIILFHDGADNCAADACAAATEIANTMPGLKVHAIGLGVGPVAKEAVACIATATGGTYIDAATPEALATAIDDIAKLAMLAPSSEPTATPAEPIAAGTPKVTSAMLRATVSLREGGAALNLPVRWRIFKRGDSTVLASSEGADFAAKLDPGSYDLEAALASLTARKTVVIEAGQNAGAALSLNAGRIRVRVNAVEGGEASASARVTLMADNAEKSSWIAVNNPTEFIVPPASYELLVSDGAARATRKIDIAAGTDQPVDIALGTGRLEVSAAISESDAGRDDVLYSVSEDDPDSPDGRREVAKSRAPSANFVLPAGTYYITARTGSVEARDRIAVGAGAVVKHVVMLPLAPLSIKGTVAGAPVTAGQGLVYKVTALDGSKKEVLRSLNPALAVQLPPGRYRIDAAMSAYQLSASKEVTLEGGKPETANFDFAAGEVSFSAGDAAAGDRYWEVHDARGIPVWRATGAAPKTLLAPGRYTVRLDVRDVSKEAAFEVKTGAKTVVEIGAH